MSTLKDFPKLIGEPINTSIPYTNFMNRMLIDIMNFPIKIIYGGVLVHEIGKRSPVYFETFKIECDICKIEKCVHVDIINKKPKLNDLGKVINKLSTGQTGEEYF